MVCITIKKQGNRIGIIRLPCLLFLKNHPGAAHHPSKEGNYLK